MKGIGKFHVITDIHLQSRFSHEKLAEKAIAGGADTIQFRQKGGSTREMIGSASRMSRICRDAGVTFIVNDRIDIAMASKADGIHLGQDDFPIPLARRLLGPDMIIGGSAATMEEAGLCLSEGADYVGFGPVFPTGSKDDAGPVSGMEVLRQVVKRIPLPIIAIGGIDEKSIPAVLKSGAGGIAVISAVCCQEDPEVAARALCQALKREESGEG